MKFDFSKYSANGNDFILINNHKYHLNRVSSAEWQKVCHRRYGVGADGVILISREEKDVDFTMQYLNADGYEVSMCGNGTRAATKFFHQEILEMISNRASYVFKVQGKVYHSELNNNLVATKMCPSENVEVKNKENLLDRIKNFNNWYITDTGVPHIVLYCEDVDKIEVAKIGENISNLVSVFPSRINVNFCEYRSPVIKVRTYERGVDAETFACGTGIVASVEGIRSLALKSDQPEYTVSMLGGELTVRYDQETVWLEGDAEKTFTGVYSF